MKAYPKGARTHRLKLLCPKAIHSIYIYIMLSGLGFGGGGGAIWSVRVFSWDALWIWLFPCA